MATFRNTKAFGKHLEKVAEQAIEKVVVEAYESLVNLSPVDQGTFRANWNISSGTEEERFVENRTNRKVDMAEVKNAARLAMNGQPIFITNGAPYARRLEYGHSEKSQGMLRITTQRLKRRGNK